jgi:hypothetical protein
MDNKAWQDKLNRARKVEVEILRWYQKNVDKEALLAPGGCKEYDIICEKVGNVEVKEDVMAHQTEHFAIEYLDANDEPSGIGATTAREFVLVDWEMVYRFKTDVLKYTIKECNDKRSVGMGYTSKGGKRARGWLIPKNVIEFSPCVHKIIRWF